jgi:hypothetical protein
MQCVTSSGTRDTSGGAIGAVDRRGAARRSVDRGAWLAEGRRIRMFDCECAGEAGLAASGGYLIARELSDYRVADFARGAFRTGTRDVGRTSAGLHRTNRRGIERIRFLRQLE